MIRGGGHSVRPSNSGARFSCCLRFHISRREFARRTKTKTESEEEFETSLTGENLFDISEFCPNSTIGFCRRIVRGFLTFDHRCSIGRGFVGWKDEVKFIAERQWDWRWNVRRIDTWDRGNDRCRFRIFFDREYFDRSIDDRRMFLYNHERNIRFHAIRIDRLNLYPMTSFKDTIN